MMSETRGKILKKFKKILNPKNKKKDRDAVKEYVGPTNVMMAYYIGVIRATAFEVISNEEKRQPSRKEIDLIVAEVIEDIKKMIE